MTTKTIQISVRITEDQRERWEQHAAEDHRTLADWVRLNIEKLCDQLEAEKKNK